MATSASDEVVPQSELESVKSPEIGNSEDTEEKTTTPGQTTQNEQPEKNVQTEETKKATVETGQVTAETVTVFKAGQLTKQGQF